jgi:hypothetical protein
MSLINEQLINGLYKNELLVVLSSISSKRFVLIDRITDESAHSVLSRILGEKNNEWWLYLKKNKYILDFLNIYPVYHVYNNNYPKNVIIFVHDYLNQTFICDFLEGYKNYIHSETDAIDFLDFYKKHHISMNKIEKDFYNWLKQPLENREINDNLLVRWNLL